MSQLLPFKVGLIGGTGFGNPSLWNERREFSVGTTPFGDPSDVLVEGTIGDVPCVFVSRHGRGHGVSPTRVNYRANLWALREAGARVILATSACGSLREEIRPGQMVVLDSFFDRTTKREQTFYDGRPSTRNYGKETAVPLSGVCHIPMAPAFNEKLRGVLKQSLRVLDYDFHSAGTMVCIEGPRFSTPAESRIYRECYGAQLVGMTVCPEAVLAKELGLPYASLGLVTDYDCWRESEEKGAENVGENCVEKSGCHVDVPSVMAVMAKLGGDATRVVCDAVRRIAAEPELWRAEVAEAERVAREAVMNPVEEGTVFELFSGGTVAAANGRNGLGKNEIN